MSSNKEGKKEEGAHHHGRIKVNVEWMKKIENKYWNTTVVTVRSSDGY